MKKFLLSAFVVLTFAIYAWNQRSGTSSTNLIANNNSSSTSSAPSDTASQSSPQTSAGSSTPPSTSSPSTPSMPATMMGKYKNGTYTGNSADAFYGNIQVKVTISGGKITDVVFLDYPKDRGNSIEINSQAMPMLKQEVISAQSANINMVSGATATSGAFLQSLQSALSQAS